MALPRVAQLLTLYNVRSKKVLGQNFLLNPVVTDRIARYTAPKKTDGRVLHVEVGPGPGGLTRSVLKAGATHLIAVEKDLTMSPLLGQLRDSTPGRFRYILDDMLLSDQLVLFDRIMAQAAECDQDQQIVFEKQLPQPQPSQDDHPIISTATETSFDKVHLVGNLPYSISSQLLAMWMQQAAARQYLFSFPTTEMTLMFQRELCERIEAPAGTKLRGRLSVVCQALFNVKMVTTVDRKLFKPVPKVRVILNFRVYFLMGSGWRESLDLYHTPRTNSKMFHMIRLSNLSKYCTITPIQQSERSSNAITSTPCVICSPHVGSTPHRGRLCSKSMRLFN
ncbi:hypothetical protein BASA62_009156 [Batrachochytrium salamandrivorans]|nr:hypothetical protein BASA62_009156 [Batrachochytrium salamandrivorans]